MSILCLGMNHRTAPIDLRERLAFSPVGITEALEALRALDAVDEAVMVSTCNRVELYAGLNTSAADAEDAVVECIRDLREVDDSVRDHLYALHDHDAVRHLFEVVAGLDSMVLGETEIFGQVKSAYQHALGQSATGKRLNKIFQSSFSVGKKVRNHTGIQRGSTSIGSVAVELAERIFGDLKSCDVMVLGAGEMSRVTTQSLVSRGAKSVIVSNRSFDKAQELAEAVGGEAIRFDQWKDRVNGFDILISSTAARNHIITKEDMVAIRKKRGGRPLFLIDIAVPRDIAPEVNELDEIYLYDIDALQTLASEARNQREAQIAECRQMIDGELRARLNGVMDFDQTENV